MTPKKLRPDSWHWSQVPPVSASNNVCLAEDMVVPLKVVKATAWQFSQGVVFEGM